MAKSRSVVEEKPAVKKFKFKNESQRLAWDLMETKPIVCLVGFPGSGKSRTALEYARFAIESKLKKECVVIRSPLESGRARLGFLKGTILEKMSVWATPILDLCNRMRWNYEPSVTPPCYIQGVTFVDSVIIVDECQNLTIEELVSVITRMDETSQIIMCGDPDQDTRNSDGLVPFLDAVRELDCVGIQEFTILDNCRHPAIAAVWNALRRNGLV
jgi:phosphate starvation-inducible PhoH-like protein